VNCRDETGEPALLKASRAGHVETMAVLLKNGADINATSTNNSTALYHAVVNKHIAAVRLLVDMRVNPNITTTSGGTPLAAAICRADRVVAALLLRAGAVFETPYCDTLEDARLFALDCDFLGSVDRWRDAVSRLIEWQLAMAPLRLPIYIYLAIGNQSISLPGDQTSVERCLMNRCSALSEVEKLKVIQGVMDACRRVAKQREKTSTVALL